MNRPMRSILLGCVLSCLLAGPALAANGWDLRVKARTGEEEASLYRVQIDEANIRAQEIDGTREFMLTSEGFTLINHDEKSFWTLTFEQLEQLLKLAAMNGDVGEVEDALEGSSYEIKTTGEKARIAGLKTRELLLTEDGEPIARAWVADEIAADAILETVGRLVDMAPASMKGGLGQLDLYKHLTGFPVKLEDLSGGYSLEVLEAERVDLPDVWVAPEGYTAGSGLSME